MKFGLICLCAFAAISAEASGQGARQLRWIAASGSEFSGAVVVPAELSLAHTTQILPVDGSANIVGETAADQAAAVLGRLLETLRAAGSDSGRVVKVNLYARDHASLAEFRAVIAKRWDSRHRAAMSAVITRLPHPDALVALDAVAVANKVAGEGSPPYFAPLTLNGGVTAAVLPPGRRAYISGQADPAPTLAEATRKTLQGLDETLRSLRLDRRRVVQAKAFLAPMSSSEEARGEIVKFFGDGVTPPFVMVEWRGGPPIEIELIVAAGPASGDATVEYLAPPALKPSPVFSRVARVNRGDLVYVSDLAGPAGADGKAQVESIFDSLKARLVDAGGDMRHLVKATYYVSDDEASTALNELRPKYYDPARPPAASKATVSAVGAEGRSVTVDMIAVVPSPPK